MVIKKSRKKSKGTPTTPKTPTIQQNPSKWSIFAHSLFDQVPGHSLVFLRMAWGVVMLSEIIRFMEADYHLTKTLLADPLYMYKYPYFEWINKVSLDTWKVLLDIMSVCCILFSIGLLYHLAAVTFFFLFAFLFLQDATMYLNHYYLILILNGLFSVLPANRMLAVDPYLKIARHSQTVPYWTVWVCRMTISIVYIYAAIAKMNEDWIRGEPLLHWVPRRCRLYPSICWILQDPLTSIAMSWCGLLFDLLCPFLFSVGGMWRKLAFAASTFFHFANMMLFNIGIFPIFMLAISMIYCPPDWPLVIMRKVTRMKLATPVTIRRNKHTRLTFGERCVLLFLVAFLAVQIFLPIRHLLYPGDVVWNELGHYYSWRMKLRDKVGITTFYVTPSYREASTDNSRPVRVQKFLSESQIQKMGGRPQFMFQTIDEICKRYQFAFKERPQVHVVSLASVNYRADQFMLDPTVNLANVTNRHEYMIPFVPRDCDSSCPYVVEELKRADESDGKASPKKRLIRHYQHVGLTEAQEFFKRSQLKSMPYEDRMEANTIYGIVVLVVFVVCMALGLNVSRVAGVDEPVVTATVENGDGSETKKRR